LTWVMEGVVVIAYADYLGRWGDVVLGTDLAILPMGLGP